jgi:hypothetical protein
LQPRISTETEGTVDTLVCVTTVIGVSVGANVGKTIVGAVVAVIKGMGVEVAICGVQVGLAPITTGVGVKMDGVLVGGRNGVGGLNGPGWITQPLQDAVISVSRMAGRVFFISSPPYDCTPHAT